MRTMPAGIDDDRRVIYLDRVRRVPTAMTAEVFDRRITAQHDWLGDDAPGNGPGQTFAHLAGRSETQVSLWRNGHRAIPGWAWRLLNALAALAEIVGRDAVLYAIMDADSSPPSEWPEPRIVPDLRLRA